MTNREIASKFNLLGKLMELHGENAFKTRSYTSAYLNIKKWPKQLAEMTSAELADMQGVGKAIQAKIQELLQSGTMQLLETYKEKTPLGIQELLTIKGFGPKKIQVVWAELGIESAAELLKAIDDNKLVALKGFGAKTQATLRERIAYHLDSIGKIHFATAKVLAEDLLALVRAAFPDAQTDLSGEIARKCDIISQLALITTIPQTELEKYFDSNEDFVKLETAWYYKTIAVVTTSVSADSFYYELAKGASDAQFWSALTIPAGSYDNEEAVFEKNELPYYPAEYREAENLEHLESFAGAHNMITESQIRGCVHNHSTYSDGMNTLEEMLDACIDKGYEYFVITDHSKSAFYANGLQEERLMQQLDEIRDLDQQEPEIRFFSGIESDILSDGALDYEDHILAELDVIVSSVHSNLNMDEKKATKRLITAIENPYTSILGHPTGRLLLSRPGYPIDHKKVIDACAANGVALELNANPNRLDTDWRWLNYAINKEVMISINPDAHSIRGIDDITYGVAAARKAGLPISYCLNAMDIDSFEEWLEEQHSKRP